MTQWQTNSQGTRYIRLTSDSCIGGKIGYLQALGRLELEIYRGVA